MKVATEEIRRLRNRCVWDQRVRYKSEKARAAEEQMIAILNELLEYRDTLVESEEAPVTREWLGLWAVPLEGTVS